MKKHFTVISALFLATGVSFSQVAKSISLPQKQAKQLGLAPFNGEIKGNDHGSAKAEGDIIWSSNFSDPSDWTIATSGQGTFQIGTAPTSLTQYMGAMASTTASNGYAYFNGVQYLIGGAVDPQNTSITSPSQDFTGIDVVDITFQQRYRAFNSDVTYVEFSADGGATWTSEVINATVATNAPAIQNTITLTFNVGGTSDGLFRFRWENPTDDDQFGSGYGWMVDDVVISEGYANNVTLVHTYSSVGVQELSYTKFPVGQAANAGNISFGAHVKNIGVSNLNVGLNVTSGAYDETGSYIAIAPFATDSVSISLADGFAIPTSAGPANLTFTAVADGVTLSQTADDSKVANFEVTNFTYAADHYNGTPQSMTGSFVSWQNPSGDPAIGTLYEIFDNASVGAFDVGIASIPSADQGTYIGRDFFVKLYRLEGTDFVYVDESLPHTIVASNFGQLVKVKMQDYTIDVNPGLYLVVAASYQGSEVPIGLGGLAPAGSTIGMDGSDFVSLISESAAPNFVRTPIVRLDFQSYVSVSSVSLEGVKVYPNPSTGMINVSNDLNVENTIIVTDLTGKVVTSKVASVATTIDLSTSGAGVYLVEVANQNGKKVERVVVK